MAEVFWFKVPDEAGHSRTYPKKGTDAAIERMGGEKVWGSVEEVDHADLDSEGLYLQPKGRLADLSPQNLSLIERLSVDVDKGEDWDRIDITGADLNRLLDAAREDGPLRSH